MDRDYHTLLLHIIRGHNILLVETPCGLCTDTTGFEWTGDWFWKSAYHKIQSSSVIDKLWTPSTNIRGDKNTIIQTLFPQIWLMQWLYNHRYINIECCIPQHNHLKKGSDWGKNDSFGSQNINSMTEHGLLLTIVFKTMQVVGLV